MTQPQTFPERLAWARERAGFSTLTALSRASGVSVAGLSRHEAGREMPRADSLKKIAGALGVTADWLLGEDNKKPRDAGTSPGRKRAKTMSNDSRPSFWIHADLTSDPRVKRLLDMGDAGSEALTTWVYAGSDCARRRGDLAITLERLRELLSFDPVRGAAALVHVGLWTEREPGHYVFAGDLGRIVEAES